MNLSIILLFVQALDSFAQAYDNCIEETNAPEHENFTKNINSYTERKFCNHTIILSEVIQFKNLIHLNIIGDNTNVTCLDKQESGLVFINIKFLVISSLVISKCAHPVPENKSISAGISIINCTNVYISNITVSESPGIGLSVFNIYEYLEVRDSTFSNNGLNQFSGGNGVYLEVTQDSSISDATYQFTCCTFKHNSANAGRETKTPEFNRFDKGGGLCLLIRNRGNFIVSIANCTISENNAFSYGGGMYVSFHNESNRLLTITDSSYTSNHAHYGGGLYLGYLHNKAQNSFNWKSTFIRNTYANNTAQYGGGVSIFSTRSDSRNSNHINFDNCTFKYNCGHFGSAIAILPNAWYLHTDGYLPNITFANLIVHTNYVKDHTADHEDTLIRQYIHGYGAIYCSKHRLSFKGSTQFRNNNGTAFYMGSCAAYFLNNSKTNFSFNLGYYGGAIHMLSSILYMSDNTILVFKNNSAYSKGGAIYYNSFTFHTYDYSRTCFITLAKKNNRSVKERNISVIFHDNLAAAYQTELIGYGHSIHADSLLPCSRQLQNNTISLTMFNQIGNFTYYPTNGLQLATDSNYSNITMSNENVLHIVPGKKYKLPYKDIDELKQESKGVYLVTIQNPNRCNVKIDSAYTLISSPELKLKGSTGNEATILLSALAAKPRALEFRVKILPCPPGFTTENQTCRCVNNATNIYNGIKCRQQSWTARRFRSIWVGYSENEDEAEHSLITGYCPYGFCSNNVILPTAADREEMNHVVCGINRNGILCGLCAENYSVYFHSPHFRCKRNKYCELGWLFYILSEIPPVTLIFLTILFFGITFTSGMLNGFIFYSQVVVMFHVTADNFIQIPQRVAIINGILHASYMSFNLHTFAGELTSFCLYKDASALDIIAFSYVTLAYSLILVITIILFMNKINFIYPLRKYLGNQWKTLDNSMIHGLSAFLVLCYSNCTRVSLLLITFANIRGKGGEHQHYAVYYKGSLIWLSPQHLRYAIPAILLTLVLTILPPLFLLAYPIHYRILNFLKLSETRCVQVLFNPLEKLKPLMDSFQGCFKDEFRFFSGLYFLYRFLFLLNITFNSFQHIYFLILTQLLVMIILHGLCQPYKKRIHNLIDTLLFGNLAAINVITIYNKSKNSNGTTTLAWIQSILIALPLLIMVFIILAKLSVLLSKKMKGKTKSLVACHDDNDEELPARLLCELTEFSLSNSYKRFQSEQ